MLRIVEEALADALVSPQGEWRMRNMPKEWSRTAGRVTMVVHPTATAPCTIDRDVRLGVYADVGAVVEVMAIWFRTVSEAKSFADRWLAGDII